MNVEKCFLCDKLFLEDDDVSVLTERGVSGIQKTCKERKITEFHICIGQKVHKKCRARFVNLKTSFQEKEVDATTPRVLRSCEAQFDFRKNCFFCGTEISLYFKERKKSSWFIARTIEFKSSILKKCNERNDEWAEKVKRRIQNVSDLHAADACYHKQCYFNFQTGKLVPLQFTDNPPTSSGRPEDSIRQKFFLQLAKEMEEHDEEQTTVNKLVDRMRELLPENSEPYSSKYMKQKLKEHFGDNIFIGTVAGTANIVTFKSTATHVLQEYHSQSHENVEEDRNNLIMAAAEILRNDIKDIPVDPEIYPSIENIRSVDYNINYIPDSLRLLLSVLVSGKTNRERKIASIGQAVMQAVRPRVLVAPLQIGLAVQLHDNTSSKVVVETINHMGFCSSYTEVLRFERSAAAEQNTNIPVTLESTENTQKFVQYAADNIDHNIITMDGHGTFHGMGIIATVTPAGKFSTVIKKRQISFEELKRLGKIPIKTYHSQASGTRFLKYNTIKDIAFSDPSANLDILLNISHLLSKTVPGWQGVCQLLHKGNHPGVSSIIFLPMINMNPTDETCILSTLFFVADHAKRYRQTPILTFDQPLFHKALAIIANESSNSILKKIILRLGGLHTIMSFLGCIGFLMSGAGLTDILEIIYAENAVKHMLSGKAIARAIRGHLIVSSALNTILATQILDDNDLQTARTLLNSLLNLELSLEDITHDTISKIETKLLKAKEELKNYRTPRLWLLYLEMVNILKKFLKAERTGNWHLHLAMVKEMLPFFAACGHNLYASSARLYYEKMVELEFEAPDVHTAFTNGLHIVRRSDRFWGGLSTDLVIEQVLMKNIKGFGGMTHGKGMSEQQQLIWVMSRPICAYLNECMQEFTSVKPAPCEQHVTMTSSRIARDNEDTQRVLMYVEKLNVFGKDNNLRNVVTGVTYGNDANPDFTEEIGEKILNEMNDKTVCEFVFRKIKQVKPLKLFKSIQFKEETIAIEPELLFQRLLLCAQTSGVDLQEVFCYELCSYPASLFDKHGFMRESGKSQLAKYMREQLPDIASMPENMRFVIDGGWLLHRLPWNQKQTFDELFCAYERFVLTKYGKATIVFDGYGDTFSTKSEAHFKRNRGIAGPKVNFIVSTSITLKKELFLSNNENRQTFISELSKKLQEAGCKTKQSYSDADIMIVLEAIESAKNYPTVVVGEDTDLLILLLYYFKENLCDIFLCPEPKKSSKNVIVYDIRKLVNILGTDVCSNILFAHAILGCDTTSKPFGIRKIESIKLLKQKSEIFKESATMFQTAGKSTKDIENAGLNAIISLYGGKAGDNSLHDMRLRTFTSKATKSAIHVKPEVLPPTENACKFHSLRVYHQVQQWLSNYMDPLEWGFELKDGRLVPIKMSQTPAPDYLLKFVKCGCVKSQCATLQCICKRQGIACSDACSECRGISCCNSMEMDMDDD